MITTRAPDGANKKNYSILLISARLCGLDKPLFMFPDLQRAESRAEAEIESEIALWNLRRGRRCLKGRRCSKDYIGIVFIFLL